MKTPKSNAEIQIEAAINHMEVMMSKQPVRTEDAEYLIGTSYKVLYKCEELRKSRDNWRNRAEKAESKLKWITTSPNNMAAHIELQMVNVSIKEVTHGKQGERSYVGINNLETVSYIMSG